MLTPPYPTKKYQALVVDPPWNQGKTGKRIVAPNQGTTLDYPTMTTNELRNLPIGEWAADTLFMWLARTVKRMNQS